MSPFADEKVSRRRMYGIPGTNTKTHGKWGRVETVIAADGESMKKPGCMYRMEEAKPGRRMPEYPHIHNLSPSVLERTTRPPMDIKGEVPTRWKNIWDGAAKAVTDAMADLEPGTHIAVTGNSGACDSKFESQAPSSIVPGAKIGFLFVAEFRTSADPIHEDWWQIAVPILPTEGRLLAGLRLIPTVLERRDLSFTVTNLVNLSVPYEMRGFIRDCTDLPYGSVSNSWMPTNLGCWFHHGGLYRLEYDIIRASFAWDGDLYAWDEATVCSRKPIALISYSKPVHRFDHWLDETDHDDVNWVQVVDGKAWGSFQKVTRRADIISWDKDRIPNGEIRAYSEEDAKRNNDRVCSLSKGD